ncbi:MAG: tRNA (5-methylaminomethyl-2-thiouridine)(34)-methyltransferase MnmD [Chitinophagales bacterium]|nr:tRNA (5-methylaminomethyl-2-thiouridine)(34)-methyltransferase MnmD [Bacteroidota bacterium]
MKKKFSKIFLRAATACISNETIPILEISPHLIQFTDDGSHSILATNFDALFHSQHGAIQESEVVFIQAGLAEIATKITEIRILEMGFGSGLNVFLSYLYAINHQLTLHYTALEAYPLAKETALQLNYPQILQAEQKQNIWQSIHQSSWNVWSDIEKNVLRLKKWQTFLQETHFPETYDLVYYDAFAPSCQPELWEQSIFEKIYRQLNEGGILCTYCSKGEVRRNMQRAGFKVEKLPGPKGKREILRARKEQ